MLLNLNNSHCFKIEIHFLQTTNWFGLYSNELFDSDRFF